MDISAAFVVFDPNQDRNCIPVKVTPTHMNLPWPVPTLNFTNASRKNHSLHASVSLLSLQFHSDLYTFRQAFI
jgi:hypothetical protein